MCTAAICNSESARVFSSITNNYYYPGSYINYILLANSYLHNFRACSHCLSTNRVRTKRMQKKEKIEKPSRT